MCHGNTEKGHSNEVGKRVGDKGGYGRSLGEGQSKMDVDKQINKEKCRRRSFKAGGPNKIEEHNWEKTWHS